jgi:hypothetical protein
VVTGFEFGLHPFGPLLHRGTRVYPASQVHEVWAMVRDYAGGMPDAVSLILAIAHADPAAVTPGPGAGEPVVVIGYNHSGDAATVESDLAPLSAGPEPTSRTDVSQPYLEVQTAHDLVMGWGHRSYIGGILANDVRAEALDALVDHVARGPAGGSFGVTVQGGAIARVPEVATAFTGREARFDLSADAGWDDPAEDDANSDWVRQALAIVAPDAVTGRYCNESSAAGPDVSRAIYGEAKFARLQALKRVWDPDNVFHLNYNIEP